MKRKKRLITKLLFVILTLFIIVVSITVASYLMAVYRPSEYSPVPISYDKQELAVDKAIALVADIHNNIYAEYDFSQTFHSKLINQLLLHDDLRQVLENEFIGSDFSLEHPQVSLRDQKIIFYITMNYSRHRVVVSVILKPFIDSSGNLVIELAGIKSGTLGIPMSTINDFLIQAADSINEYSNDLEKEQNSDDKNINMDIGCFIGKSLPELLRSKRVEISPIISKPDEKNVSINLVGISISDQKAELSFKQSRK